MPLAVSSVSLLIAAIGLYWDVSLHIDQGATPALANPSHFLSSAACTAFRWLARDRPPRRPGPPR
jgi:hypothetical protein